MALEEGVQMLRTLGWLGAGMAALASIVLATTSAQAVPVVIGQGGSDPFVVDPLYFIAPTPGNPDPVGLVGPGNGVDWIVPAGAFSFSACGTAGGCDLSIGVSLLEPVIQSPQKPQASQNPQTPQGSPTPNVPFVADSDWTVRNAASQTLTDAWLLFTAIDFTGGYPEIPVGLDQLLYDVVQIGEGSEAAWYGALSLGTLAPGQEKTLRVRYIVAGDLPDVGGSLVIPPFGVSGLVVPEPATLSLAGIGLVALALARRRRCR